MYETITLGGVEFIRRIADEAIIPSDPGNADYQAYLTWVAAGNTANVSTPSSVPITTMTPLQFMARITSAEQTTIMTGALQNPSVMLWLLKLSSASYVDVTDSLTIAGVQALESANLIAVGRSAAILAPPTT